MREANSGGDEDSGDHRNKDREDIETQPAEVQPEQPRNLERGGRGLK